MSESDRRVHSEPILGAPVATRRLADKISTAFHQACDQGDLDTARALLDVLEFVARRATTTPHNRERRDQNSLVAAHERLWELQRPENPPH